MLNMVAALTIAVIAFGLRVPVEGILGVVSAMLVATLAICGLGLFLGALAYIVLDTAILANFAMFIILLLSGANVPLAELPGVVAAIAQGIPLTRSVAAARLYVGGGSFDAGVGLLLGDLALVIASLPFREDSHAKRAPHWLVWATIAVGAIWLIYAVFVGALLLLGQAFCINQDCRGPIR